MARPPSVAHPVSARPGFASRPWVLTTDGELFGEPESTYVSGEDEVSRSENPGRGPEVTEERVESEARDERDEPDGESEDWRAREDDPWLVGAHVSVAGGPSRAVDRARRLDATAMQIFTGQPQRWADPELSTEAVEAFRDAVQESPVGVVVSHDSYLINLASPDRELFRKSLASFSAELERCRRLGVDFVVTHPGNATDGNREAGIGRNAEALGSALADSAGQVTVLVETTAGTGTSLGWRFEELAELIERVPLPERERVGVCLDTCHAWAAGYDLRGAYEDVVAEFDRVLGLELLQLLHLNDSRHPLGSRKDRHADIGGGELGEEPFGALMRDSRLVDVPRVIETPKGDDHTGRDRRNLGLLRRLGRSSAP